MVAACGCHRIQPGLSVWVMARANRDKSPGHMQSGLEKCLNFHINIHSLVKTARSEVPAIVPFLNIANERREETGWQSSKTGKKGFPLPANRGSTKACRTFNENKNFPIFIKYPGAPFYIVRTCSSLPG